MVEQVLEQQEEEEMLVVLEGEGGLRRMGDGGVRFVKVVSSGPISRD